MIDVQHVRLVLAAAAWERLRPLLVDHDRFATGTLRWRSTGEGVEALADDAHVADQAPRGVDRAPLDDFFVVAVRHDPQLTAHALLERIAPRPSQMVVVLVLDAHQRQQWEGLVSADGATEPLVGFHVAGAGMLTVEKSAASGGARRDSGGDVALAAEDVAFSRLRGAVGELVYGKLRRAVVTQVGVSRNGTLAAQQFAALGIARLRLADPQRVGEENLDGMPGLSHQVVGQFKAHAVGAMIAGQRPDLGVTCCERSVFDPAVMSIFAGRTDLLVSCVDEDAARVAVSMHALRLLVPHLDIGTSVQRGDDGATRIFGDARLFLPGQGCAACVPPLSAQERDDVLYDLAAPVGALRRGVEKRWHEERAGSLITINAATVSAGVAAWLDLLAGQLRTSLWQRLDWITGEGLRVNSSPVGAGENCPFCRGG